MPNGFGQEGLPTSLTLMGAAFSEELLLDVAYLLQGATDWHLQRPAID
jgi:aspartyl-tRNA(Asn)/glutamyl-tRNA(Gln) amidotransferase subunit A